MLNGGEVAALAITEAVVRLLPGFMGNPESLAEESHEDGLLEYPVYTKPASWRGHDVPAGAALRRPRARSPRWRHDQAVRRTAERRPDLAHPRAVLLDDVEVRLADAGRRRASSSPCSGPAGSQEEQDNPGVEIPALHETLDDVRAVARRVARCSWSGPPAGWSAPCAAAARRGGVWDIGRLMVAPDLQGRGLGRLLLEHDRGRGAGRRRRRTRCSPAPAACATSGCTRRPATGCRPAEVAPRRASALTKRRTDADRISGARPRLWQTCLLGPVGRRTAPRTTRGGSASGSCHRGSCTPPATHDAGRTIRTIPDTAADLWHSRGET